MDIIGTLSNELVNFIGNIFSFLTRPIGQATTVSTGIILFQGWKIINSIHKPVAYVEKLYDAADHIIEQADNNFIDKIRNSQIKDDIQQELKIVLLNRKQKIDQLIKKIGD